MTDLATRMQKTVPGQITWAEPEICRKCSDCKHCIPHPKPKIRRPDQCKLVKAMTRRVGEPFDGKKAIACPKLEM